MWWKVCVISRWRSLFVHLSICLSIYLSLYLSAYISLFISILDKNKLPDLQSQRLDKLLSIQIFKNYSLILCTSYIHRYIIIYTSPSLPPPCPPHVHGNVQGLLQPALTAISEHTGRRTDATSPGLTSYSCHLPMPPHNSPVATHCRPQL